MGIRLLIFLSSVLFSISGLSQCWRDIVVGNYHVIALRSDGTIWSWGLNTYGQLGNGNILKQSKPIQIGSDKNWTYISAGDNTSFAIKSDGTLWAWGNNSVGQLGIGTSGNYKSSPIRVGVDNDWAKVDGSLRSSYGIKNNGLLWSFGNGILYPKSFYPFTFCMEVSVGEGHTLCLTEDYAIWAWGFNPEGQLGIGTYNSTFDPVQIGSNYVWQLIKADSKTSLAIDSDGTLWGWGKFEFGQNLSGNVPKRLFSNYAWKDIDGNGFTLAGIQQDGSLWVVGKNESGQLGDGSTLDQNFPIQIGNDKNWQKVVRSILNTYALKSDGTLWVTGRNDEGQLGLGDISSTLNFLEIPCPNITSSEIGIIGTSDFIVFPNPVRNKLNIKYLPLIENLNNVNISIFNSFGIKLLDKTDELLNIGDFDLTLDLANIPNGIYTIKLVSGSVEYHSVFIKINN